MDRPSFESAEPIVDEMAEQVHQILESDQFAAIREALARLSESSGTDFSVNCNVIVDVFDPKRGHPLPLLTTGFSTSGGQPPYRTWGDSSPQKYVVSGDIQVVPHDRCPRCYGTWDFKFKQRSCTGCGATLGRDVKLLLDTDRCPNCEEGKVSMSAPECTKCGHRVDPGLIVWG